MQYIYPKLPAVKTNAFFRIGGNGLANCLFVYAKAIVIAHLTGAKLISPTWFNLTIGTYLRRQKDKRHYLGLINSINEINRIKKFFFLATKRKTSELDVFQRKDADILIIEGIYDFFTPLIDYQEVVSDYILTHINKSLLTEVDQFDFKNTVAVHVRLGDFPTSRRIPMEWYKKEINKHKDFRILIFSDGTDDELNELMELPNVRRVFFGGAIQDIVAISRCSYLIGSDSSFSAWGAFLGQVPCSFYRLQFGQILVDPSKQLIRCP